MGIGWWLDKYLCFSNKIEGLIRVGFRERFGNDLQRSEFYSGLSI